MRYKKFQKANMDVSSLAVGTWAIGGEMYGDVDEDNSIQAIRTMIDNGVNFVDTAPIYGDGRSEIIVGKALSDGYREKVILSTKFGSEKRVAGDFSTVFKDSSYDNIMRSWEKSAKSIGVDVIDVYFIHWPSDKDPISETMRAIRDLKAQGMIRAFGVSNFSKEQIMEAQKYGEVDLVQPPFSMVAQQQRELMEWCAAQGIGTATYGSLGGGILTGAYRKLPDWPKDDFRFTFYDSFREPKFSRVQKVLAVMDEIAAAHDATVAQVAINWSTQLDFVGTAMCGVRNAKEALDNCSAFTWSLTDAEMKTLNDAIAANNIAMPEQ